MFSGRSSQLGQFSPKAILTNNSPVDSAFWRVLESLTKLYPSGLGSWSDPAEGATQEGLEPRTIKPCSCETATAVELEGH